jgi:hypothetical protein
MEFIKLIYPVESLSNPYYGQIGQGVLDNLMTAIESGVDLAEEVKKVIDE